MKPLKLLIILFFVSANCYAQGLPQVLSKQDLRDAYYRIPYRTAQKRCQSCPEPKYGYDITSDTLLSYVAQDVSAQVVINRMKPVDRLPGMQFSINDSTNHGEITVPHFYKGKQVYQQSIYSSFTADQVIVKSGMDKIVDINGWVAFDYQFSNGTQTFRNSTMCRGCNYEISPNIIAGERVLVVNKPQMDPPWQSNHRYYMRIWYTKP